MNSEIRASRPENRKRLMRHPACRIAGGVCGGIADYTGASVSTIRVLAVIFLLVPSLGIGPLLYIILWLYLPSGTQAMGQVRAPIIQSRARRHAASAFSREPEGTESPPPR